MPPASPIREQAKEQIVERLRAMQAGDRYHYTPSLVTRALLGIDQYLRTPDLWPGPIIGVQRSQGSRARTGPRGDDGLSSTLVHELIVDITVYMRGDGADVVDTRLENAWDDIRKHLEMEPTLGGVADGIELYGDLEMNTDRGHWEPYGSFVQPYRVGLTENVTP